MTRDEFREWADATAAAHGYGARIVGIGDEDEEFGHPTQMAVFSRLRDGRARGGRIMTRQVKIPALSLVMLIGASGSGKSTFAARHFLPTEVISSDFARGLVSDDENDQTATKDAFDVVHYIVGQAPRARQARGGRRHQHPAERARGTGAHRARARRPSRRDRPRRVREDVRRAHRCPRRQGLWRRGGPPPARHHAARDQEAPPRGDSREPHAPRGRDRRRRDHPRARSTTTCATRPVRST